MLGIEDLAGFDERTARWILKMCKRINAEAFNRAARIQPRIAPTGQGDPGTIVVRPTTATPTAEGWYAAQYSDYDPTAHTWSDQDACWAIFTDASAFAAPFTAKYFGKIVGYDPTGAKLIIAVVPAAAGGADTDYYQTVQLAGTAQTQRGKLNLKGGGLTVLDESGSDRTTYTIPDFSGARVTTGAAALAPVSAAWTAIPLPTTVKYDTDSYYTNGATSFNVPRAGYYGFGATVVVSNNGDGTFIGFGLTADDNSGWALLPRVFHNISPNGMPQNLALSIAGEGKIAVSGILHFFVCPVYTFTLNKPQLSFLDAWISFRGL